MRITGTTRVFALLGDPVAHSLSPVMQNAAFDAAGLDAVYLPIRCTAEDLPGVIRTLAGTGGGGNVTVPHKLVAAKAGTPDARVRALDVANVFWANDGQPMLGNTDVDGLLALLERVEAPSTTWCVVGTGGSARAAVAAAGECGARIAVRSRSDERARNFLAWAAGLGVDPAEVGECEVLINATPVGLGAADPPPVALTDFPKLAAVADLTYRAEGATALVRVARDAGARAEDGREMLLIQGAAAWSRWFPGVGVPVEVMRAALAGRMA